MVAMLIAACGSKHTETASPTEAKEHAEMPAELAKFHDVLAPRWHADKGPQRMQETCAALPDFHANAEAIAKSTPPRGANADTWTTGTKQLVDAVAGLDTTCKSNDSANFETAFQKVHESFHGLLAASGGEHDEKHEEMEHKM